MRVTLSFDTRVGRCKDHREEEIKAVSIGSFISCFELHGAPLCGGGDACLILPNFPKCCKGLDSQMLPFVLKRSAFCKLRTILKALLMLPTEHHAMACAVVTRWVGRDTEQLQLLL